jgi:hypothetical protein
MRKSLLILGITVIMTASGFCQSDTITYWKVYFNNNLINEFSVIDSNPVVTLNYSDINNSSILTVKYNRDTPCHDCSTSIIVQNSKHKAFFKIKGHGTNNPMDVQLYKIIGKRVIKEERKFLFYYKENHYNDQLLFTLIIDN